MKVNISICSRKSKIWRSLP